MFKCVTTLSKWVKLSCKLSSYNVWWRSCSQLVVQINARSWEVILRIEIISWKHVSWYLSQACSPSSLMTILQNKAIYAGPMTSEKTGYQIYLYPRPTILVIWGKSSHYQLLFLVTTLTFHSTWDNRSNLWIVKSYFDQLGVLKYMGIHDWVDQPNLNKSEKM